MPEYPADLGNLDPNAPYALLDSSQRVMADRLRLPVIPAFNIASCSPFMDGIPSSGSATGYTSRQPYVAAVACTDLRLVMPAGIYLNTTGEAAMAQATPIKAAIELASGTIIPVTFGGVRVPTVDIWGYVVSEPLAVALAAGDVFYVRTRIVVDNTQKYMTTACTSQPGMTTSGVIGYSTGDVVDSGTINSSDPTIGFWAPQVWGTPTGTPVAGMVVVGDSISVGVGDTTNGGAWWKYGINATLPAILYARLGITAQAIASTHAHGFPLFQGGTHAVVFAGNNDPSSRTAVQIEADLTTIYTALINRGMKVYGCTLTPRTTSTDSWATTANQTAVTGYASGGVRSQVNTWITAGGGGKLTGVYDLASAAESAPDSGLWKVTGAANFATADGTHPTHAMHVAMGALLHPADFTLAA